MHRKAEGQIKAQGAWDVCSSSGGSRRGRGPRGLAAGQREVPHAGTCHSEASQHRDKGTCHIPEREKQVAPF